MTRRGVVAAAAALAASAPTTKADSSIRASIRKAAAASGRFFGAAAQIGYINAERDLYNAFLRDCGCLTPEIDLKWATNEPSPGVFDFRAMDGLARFASRTGLRIRGHTPVWHKSIPSWAEAALADADWRPVERYIATTLKRFPDVEEWDVVNEPIETGRRTDGLRDSPFLKAFGPSYIQRALEAAHEHAPHARLMINEFGLEYDTQEHRDRRYHLLKLVERLKRVGAPLHGVGLQSHLQLDRGTLSQPQFAAFLHELAQFDVAITLTELDVKEAAYATPAEARDQAVADAVRAYLDVAFAEPRVAGLLCWGLSDRHSWLALTDEDWARHAGAWQDGDGPGFNRGAPFDAALRPKPMYRAILEAFATAPRR